MAHKSGSMPHLMDLNSMDDQQLPLLSRVPCIWKRFLHRYLFSTTSLFLTGHTIDVINGHKALYPHLNQPGMDLEREKFQLEKMSIYRGFCYFSVENLLCNELSTY